MKILSIRKQWDKPNQWGDNRFEIEFLDDKGEMFYTGFIAVDEIEAYKLFMQSFEREF